MRLDLYLVKHNFCDSRSKAQDLIQSGSVEVYKDDSFVVVTSASLKIKENTEVRLVSTELLKYVARSGLKLEKALKKVKLTLQDKAVLDVGQSTGGFTDCVLQLGAQKVVGVDVGHGQLDQKIKSNTCVEAYEGVNAKNLLSVRDKNGQVFSLSFAGFFDFCCIDVSFISLRHIIKEVFPLLRHQGHLLALVKPQFEVGQKYLKNGVVNQPEVYDILKSEMLLLAKNNGFQVLDYMSSELIGKKGNKEFFLYATKP